VVRLELQGNKMKRVPLLKKDYPENFNKVAKYIGKNLTVENIPLEQSRQLLAKLFGYNSIHELENSFVEKIPNLISVDMYLNNINNKIHKYLVSKLQEDTNYSYSHILSILRDFDKKVFIKIPFYLINALDKAKEDIFKGNYNEIAMTMPLFTNYCNNYGFYGIFLPYINSFLELKSEIDNNELSLLLDFFSTNECFPFGKGETHLSVITDIKDRADKYFTSNGTWKLKVLNEKGREISYDEVVSIIFSLAKDDKKDMWEKLDYSNHWIFNSIEKAIENFEDSSINKELAETKLIEIDMETEYFKESNFYYSNGKKICNNQSFKTNEGEQFKVCVSTDKHEFYAISLNNPYKVSELKNYDKEVYQIF
jgi:hypothetical protein